MTDAAERLRTVFRTSEVFGVPWEGGVVLLDQALAAERRATVERIRAAMDESKWGARYTNANAVFARVLAILDAEAEPIGHTVWTGSPEHAAKDAEAER